MMSQIDPSMTRLLLRMMSRVLGSKLTTNLGTRISKSGKQGFNPGSPYGLNFANYGRPSSMDCCRSKKFRCAGVGARLIEAGYQTCRYTITNGSKELITSTTSTRCWSIISATGKSIRLVATP